MPPSVDDWVPDSHLARFVVEVVEQLDRIENLFVEVLALARGRAW